MSEAESAVERAAVTEVVTQTVEIEEVVDEALELLDQIRYSLKTLEDRLSKLRRARESTAPKSTAES
jgi:hypothetical protein